MVWENLVGIGHTLHVSYSFLLSFHITSFPVFAAVATALFFRISFTLSPC